MSPYISRVGGAKVRHMLRLFDLPAHPLLIHFPIVAIPTLCIIGLIMAFVPSFRERYGIAAVLLGIVTTIATFFAAASGQALADEFQFGDEIIGTHRELGETLRLFVLGLTVALVVMVALGRRQADSPRDPATLLSSVGAIAFAILSMIWVIRTGHEGASSVWGGF